MTRSAVRVKRVEGSPWARYLTRYVALAYVGLMLILPVVLILWRTFRPGFSQFYAWVTTPAAISALNLSLLVVAIVLLAISFTVLVLLRIVGGRAAKREEKAA